LLAYFFILIKYKEASEITLSVYLP
jgi:hypothetical protein